MIMLSRPICQDLEVNATQLTQGQVYPFTRTYMKHVYKFIKNDAGVLSGKCHTVAFIFSTKKIITLN